MIIANALKRPLSRLTANITLLGTETPNVPIKYGYGDQKELIAWIVNQNSRVTPEKYPLTWYVLNQFTEFQGWYSVDARLVLMVDSRLNVNNEWRNDNSYTGVLMPCWEVVKNELISNQYIQGMGSFEDQFKLKTEPNYGLSDGDLKQSNPKGEQAVTIDIVDCLVIDFKMKININCVN